MMTPIGIRLGCTRAMLNNNTIINKDSLNSQNLSHVFIMFTFGSTRQNYNQFRLLCMDFNSKYGWSLPHTRTINGTCFKNIDSLNTQYGLKYVTQFSIYKLHAGLTQAFNDDSPPCAPVNQRTTNFSATRTTEP